MLFGIMIQAARIYILLVALAENRARCERKRSGKKKEKGKKKSTALFARVFALFNQINTKKMVTKKWPK